MKRFSLVIALTLLICFGAVAANAEGPRYGGSLVVVLPDDPPTLATWLSASYLPRMVAPQVVEGLLDHNPDLTPKPLLAESWETSPDLLKWTFHLRKDVKWHDGKPFTADDVVFSVNEMWIKRSPGTAKRWQSAGLTAENIDTHTVVLTLKRPYVYATHYMDSHFGPIIPKHLFEGTDIEKNRYNIEPVGTGPFKFKEYVKGSHITLEKNQNYWGKDEKGRKLPYLDRVVFRVMPDVAARLMAMQKGEIDYQCYPGFPVEAALKLKESGFQIGAEPISGLARIQRIHMNQRTGPLSDLKVRKALFHAMNRKEILEKAAYGYGTIAIGPLHQSAPVYKNLINNEVPKYEYSPEKANRMLDEAGYKKGQDGIRFKLSMTINRALSQDAACAELIRDFFQAVGVPLEIKKMDHATRLGMVAKKDFETTMWGPSITGPSPDCVDIYWHSSLMDTQEGFSNPAGMKDKEIDYIIDNAPFTVDESKRIQMWKEFQRIMVENVYEWWLYDALIVSAWNQDYEGLPQKVWGHYDALTNVYWKKGK